jgi:transcriptional regulator with XRE-family HTH domain
LNIAKLRKKLGYTQAKLAELSETESNTISRYETGKLTPSAPMLGKIAKALGTTVDILLNGPVVNELRINFVWEVEDMDILNIGSNEFNFGFRGDDVGVSWIGRRCGSDEMPICNQSP